MGFLCTIVIVLLLFTERILKGGGDDSKSPKLSCGDEPDFEASLPGRGVGLELDCHRVALGLEGGEAAWDGGAAEPDLGVLLDGAHEEVVLRLARARPLHIELVKQQLDLTRCGLTIFSCIK